MPLINVVLTLIVIPMQGTIKTILNWVVVIAVIIWLLYGFGIIGSGGSVHMPVVK